MDSTVPLTAIDTSICPIHLTISLLDIVFIPPLVVASASPAELALTMLHILMVLTFVGVGHFFRARFLPHAFAFFHTFDEDARVRVTICPAVLAITVGLAIVVLTEVHVSICKGVRSLSMPKAELPLAFIEVTVGPLVLAVAMRLVLDPLADIAVTSGTLPNTVSVLDAIDPLAIVSVAVGPCIETLA